MFTSFSSSYILGRLCRPLLIFSFLCISSYISSRRGFSKIVFVHFSYYKMPKAAKAVSHPNQRTAPYSVVTATQKAQSPTMADRGPVPSHAHLGRSHNDSHGNSWRQEEDDVLLHARQRGLNWQPIALQYFPTKTPNACRKRHERLIDKLNSASDWDQRKMDDLASFYVELRPQIWQVLAERMGETWQNVEAKVSTHFHGQTLLS